MEGQLIISLDCEGKWGFADSLQPYHQLIDDKSIGAVYRHLLTLFDRYRIPATFAFVLAFALTEAERREFPQLAAGEGRSDTWLRFYWEALDRGDTQGWFHPEAFEAVRAAAIHEIACHGFCHRPLGDSSIDAPGAAAELAEAARAAAIKGVELRTLVFPRNDVGNLGAVRDAGFLGYRAALRRPPGRLGRIVRLAEELNTRPKPQRAERPQAGLAAIPPGYFFNWRFGARRRVPPGVTVRRWRNLLNAAARKGGVAHLWLHPHNLITGPGTAETLDEVLRHATRLRDGGRLAIVTQEQFCLGTA